MLLVIHVVAGRSNSSRGYVLRLARVGTSIDSKASCSRDVVVSEESDTKGYAASVVLGVLREGASLYIK